MLRIWTKSSEQCVCVCVSPKKKKKKVPLWHQIKEEGHLRKLFKYIIFYHISIIASIWEFQIEPFEMKFSYTFLFDPTWNTFTLPTLVKCSTQYWWKFSQNRKYIATTPFISQGANKEQINTTMAKLNLLLILLLVLLTFVTTSLSCPEHHKQALLHFKASIINATSLTKSTLYRLDSWNSSLDCCHWDGVICSSRFGSMTVLALYLDDIITSNSQEPVLPSTILTLLFHIRSLMQLDLSNNSIQGELPRDGFGNLTKLVHLDLGLNLFNGSIPSQLFHLRYL